MHEVEPITLSVVTVKLNEKKITQRMLEQIEFKTLAEYLDDYGDVAAEPDSSGYTVLCRVSVDLCASIFRTRLKRSHCDPYNQPDLNYRVGRKFDPIMDAVLWSSPDGEIFIHLDDGKVYMPNHFGEPEHGGAGGWGYFDSWMKLIESFHYKVPMAPKAMIGV
jgi:hypothetical protein